MNFRLVPFGLFVAIIACSETVELGGGGGLGRCDPSGPQCNDCADNDNDGKTDGFDPECTGALDDDEGSFATGIPGDNGGGVRQDCFFDGNSGSGDDGCEIHVCCSLDLMGGACPDEFQPQSFDPSECTPSSECVAACAPLVPPGCDCFGCCTICEGQACVDIMINPAVSPGCDETTLADQALCPRCVKASGCTSACGASSCIACPGQSPDDLPPGCTATCPPGSTMCGPELACSSGEFCANGCCIGIPQ